MTLVKINSDYYDRLEYDATEVTDESHGPAINVATETLTKWQQAQEAWEACQDEMEKAERHQLDRRADRTERGTRMIPSWPA